MNRSILTLLAAGGLSLAASSACSSVDNRTQITVALESETEIPKELTSFEVKVSSDAAGVSFFYTYQPKDGSEFPTTLAVVPASSDSLDGPVRVEIEGKAGDRVLIKRMAVVSYIKNRGLLLKMPLRMACYSQVGCASDKTCIGGVCVKPQVDSATLPEFDKEQVFGDLAPKTCFNENVCLKESLPVVLVDKKPEDGDRCEFDIPSNVDVENGNVSVRWFDAPNRIISLAGADKDEGWTRLSATKGKLSKGVCESYFEKETNKALRSYPEKATAVYFSSTCATHKSVQAYCPNDALKHSGIGIVSP
jgi:hypothetical protein